MRHSRKQLLVLVWTKMLGELNQKDFEKITYFWWVDANWDSCSVGLLTLDPLDVDHELLSVALDDFANLLALVVTSYNLMQNLHIRNTEQWLDQFTSNYLNFIILSDGDVTNVVLLFQLFWQRRSHQVTTNVRRSAKVALTVLPARRRDPRIEFHFRRVSKSI